MKRQVALILVLCFAVALGGFACMTRTQETQQTNDMTQTKEIYLAGGCFWGTEHFLKQVRGVVATEVGYANGHTERPTYEEVCQHHTGFAETVRVTYAPEQLSLRQLLDLYFLTIDPTTIGRPGGDIGDQYRTGIYYTDSLDLETIRAALATLQSQYTAPLQIEVKPLTNFYNAEEYHQDYLDKNPSGYCHIRPELFEQAPTPSPRTRSAGDDSPRPSMPSPSRQRQSIPSTTTTGTSIAKGSMWTSPRASPYSPHETSLTRAVGGRASPALSIPHVSTNVPTTPSVCDASRSGARRGMPTSGTSSTTALESSVACATASIAPLYASSPRSR